MSVDEALERLRRIATACGVPAWEEGRRDHVAGITMRGPEGSGRLAAVYTPGSRWASLDLDGGFSLNCFDEDALEEEMDEVLTRYVRVGARHCDGESRVSLEGWWKSPTVIVEVDGEEHVVRRGGRAMAVVGDTWPEFPLHLSWDDSSCEPGVDYESMKDVGIDLEFFEDRDFLTPHEIPHQFIDASGRRFRVLVMSLEVVLCVAVPLDYHPTQLRLVTFEMDGKSFVVEHLDGRIHRALTLPAMEHEPHVPVETTEFGALRTRMQAVDSGTPELSWSDFDELWFAVVDPAPPINVAKVLGGLISRLFGGRSAG